VPRASATKVVFFLGAGGGKGRLDRLPLCARRSAQPSAPSLVGFSVHTNSKKYDGQILNLYWRRFPSHSRSHERAPVGERETAGTNDHASAVSLSFLALSSLFYEALNSIVHPRE
jgi:hypothetical protein